MTTYMYNNSRLPINLPHPPTHSNFIPHHHTQSLGAPLQQQIPPINNKFGFQNQPYYNHAHSSSFQGVTLPPPPGMVYNGLSNMPPPQIVAPMLRPAPILAPVPQQQQPVVSEQVNGGVNQILDYDLDLMAEFIVKYAMLAFDSESIYQYDSKSQVVTLFTKGVSSVLNATRLPSVSIFQALHFLSKYLDKLPNGSSSIGGNSVNVIYQNTMIAFILANKFNDDKTFTNKSWSEATGMELSTINEYERRWLNIFEWRLFDDKFSLYEDYVCSFDVFCQGKRSNNTVPIQSQSYYSSPSKYDNNHLSVGAKGFETPNYSNSSLNSSPFHYNDDVFDYYYNQNQQNLSTSPISQLSPSANGDFSNNYSCNFKYAPQAMGNMMSNQQPTYPTWNAEIPKYGNYQNDSYGLFDNQYYTRPAVY
ncbi:hypothetical protein Kpol_423p9 [Vanderwaltozyma polyspora DSM 70294]|uniref:Cyclin N-terminal domain-containing protein n=1 Tax=Vanderwaltozyma polyspora (strain ATCC 22028 / DSM 70294 / BCRC 21397 / CBS 2163 / NBRC 10782 / NRRL Y-8283 / UCD 57-17) TaxID=436907 RepID=A7TR86_VANPO|nr:uncharacterized protein Kpol_423p9 [Vanderwaltozyma polyspora DSM 70294]EDO15219.1 hypothetical protein Kpol_423p9 [Vanderwaltozyma polyspora DSM 70294]